MSRRMRSLVHHKRLMPTYDHEKRPPDRHTSRCLDYRRILDSRLGHCVVEGAAHYLRSFSPMEAAGKPRQGPFREAVHEYYARLGCCRCRM